VKLTVPNGCKSVLIPKTTQVICSNGNGIWTHDLLNNSSVPLPITSPDWMNVSTNGRFLYYGFSENNYHDAGIFSYDLQDRVEATVTTSVIDGIIPPILSSDGSYIAYVRNLGPWDNRVFVVEKGSEQSRQLSTDEPSATWNIVWSPVSNWILYGATTIQSDIGFSTNQLYLLDPAAGATHQIRAVDDLVYDDFGANSVWSPDGTKLVVTAAENLCVISFNDKGQSCYAVGQPGSKVVAHTWSPHSRYIAAVLSANGPIGNTLIVFDVGDQTNQVVSSSIEANLLFWR